jgi:hypothetical protein
MSASSPSRFTPVEWAPGTHWIGGWVDPRAGLDDVEKRKFFTLPRLELRPLGRPARSRCTDYAMPARGVWISVLKRSKGIDFHNVKHAALVLHSSITAFLCDDIIPLILTTIAPLDSTEMCSLETWSNLEESERFTICWYAFNILVRSRAVRKIL